MSFPSVHSVNEDRIDKDHYLGVSIDLIYPTINFLATTVKVTGPGVLMYKRDLCRAYHQIWTDPFDVPYQGFFWQGALYFDTVLVMGCTSGAYICQCVTSAIAHIHNSWGALCTNYLDDLIGVAPPEKAKRDFCKLGLLLQNIGVWESEHTACPPSSLMVVLGIMFNMIDMTISIAPEWMDEIQAELEAWCNRVKMSCKQLKSLIGKLQFTSQIIKVGHVFLAHLLDELRGSPKLGYIVVPVSILQDIKWWQYIMPILNGTKSIYLDIFFEPGVLIDTDATLVGAWGCTKVITSTPHFHSLSPSKLTSLPIWNCWHLLLHSRCGPIWSVTPSLWCA